MRMKRFFSTSLEMLPNVLLPDNIAKSGINLIRELKIDSLRAEITIFEAAKAHAAIDSRSLVETKDIRTVVPMALRLRQSEFISHYIEQHDKERNALIEANLFNSLWFDKTKAVRQLEISRT